MASVKHTRLEISEIPEGARPNVDPNAPPPLRMMAARAMVPLGPEGLAIVLYQMTLDPDEKIRKAARESASEIPEDVLGAIVSARLDHRVLDFIGQVIIDRDGLLEQFVLNQAVDDLTIATVARRASERITEVIANIHTRLLRTPAIIEALYANPSTRMSTVQKILDLAVRNDVELSGYPGLKEALASAEYDDEEGVSDEEFQRIAKESVERSEGDDDKDDDEEEDDEEDEDRRSRWQVIQDMNPAQKIRLAMIGSREDRDILLRDSRKIVHMSAVRSPKISPGEATKLASNRSLPDGVITYIAKNRDWTRFYPVISNLVNNPKCPLRESIRFLKELRPNDLKTLQRNKNVPSQLARQARAVFRKKTGAARNR